MTFATRDKPWARLFGVSAVGLVFAWSAACESRRHAMPSANRERQPSNPHALEDPVLAGDANGAGNATGGTVTSAGSPPQQPAFGSDASPQDSPLFAMDAAEPARVGSNRIVVMGDYGWAGPHEQQVAELVHSLKPDYVLTTGDNNYPSGADETIDENIGQYFGDLIYPYKGRFGAGATTNKFFPVLGNHDWYTNQAAAYLAYFTLPGNERYYDVVLGDVHFFALDSDEHEPDGVTAESVQALWLKRGLAASNRAFKIVAMHHPPHSSGPHGNTPYMQWPYAEWGADLVLAGHDHCYERLSIDGVTYIVSGLGGASLYSFANAEPGSIVRYNAQYGATILEADSEQMRLSFLDIDSKLIDRTYLRSRQH